MRRCLPFLVLIACVLLPHVTNAQIVMENRYLVYRVAEPVTIQVGVTLADQFSVHDQIGLSLEWFDAPVQKDQEPIFDPNLHHTWWRIDNPEPVRDVFVDNQFGPQALEVRDGRYLLAPALKQVPGTEPPLANHYECYVANGNRIDRPVVLLDQFGQYTTVVRDPVWFCNPVRKTHEGVTYDVVDPNIHLTCYRVDPVPFADATVTALDQFGLWTLQLIAPEWLCVPTIKFDSVPTEDASWGQVKAVYR